MNFIPFLPYMIPFGSEGKFLSISCTYNGMFVPLNPNATLQLIGYIRGHKQRGTWVVEVKISNLLTRSHTCVVDRQ